MIPHIKNISQLYRDATTGQMARTIECPFTHPRSWRRRITRRWRGDTLVGDSLTTRKEKVKKNPLRKLLAGFRNPSHLSLLDVLVSSVRANKP
jgi:hypothetical protein